MADYWDNSEDIKEVANRSGIKNIGFGLGSLFMGYAVGAPLSLALKFIEKSQPEAAGVISMAIGAARHNGHILTCYGARQMAGLSTDKKALEDLDFG